MIMNVTAACSATDVWPNAHFLCHAYAGTWTEDKSNYNVSWQPLLYPAGVRLNSSCWSYDATSSRYRFEKCLLFVKEDDTVMGKYRGNYRGDVENFTIIPQGR